MASQRVYRPVKDYTIPALDLCSLIYSSPESHSTESTVLHIEAAEPSNCVTKAQARTYTQRVAFGLREAYGIGANGAGKDVVVVISSGQVLLSPVFYGVIAAGGIYSAASSSFTAMELVRQVKQGDAKAVIASPDCKDVAVKAALECGLDRSKVLVLDSMGGKRSLKSVDGWGKDFVAGEEKHNELLNWEVVTDRNVLENRVICLLYSSGTTGVPKGMSCYISSRVLMTYMESKTKQKANRCQSHPLEHRL